MKKQQNKNNRIDTVALKQAIKQKGLSIASFGNLAGFEQRNQIHERLNRKTNITADEYVRICETLQAELEAFVR